MSSSTQGSFAPLKRFLAIFLTIWAVVFVVLAVTNDGQSRIIFVAAAVVSLIVGLYLFRSFAFVHGKEF